MLVSYRPFTCRLVQASGLRNARTQPGRFVGHPPTSVFQNATKISSCTIWYDATQSTTGFGVSSPRSVQKQNVQGSRSAWHDATQYNTGSGVSSSRSVQKQNAQAQGSRSAWHDATQSITGSPGAVQKPNAQGSRSAWHDATQSITGSGDSAPSNSAMYSTGATSNTTSPQPSFTVFKNLQSMREWRRKAFAENKTVGFVPTLGALHDGHMSLVRYSLKQNDLTVVSIFVNPSLSGTGELVQSYRETPEADLALISSVSIPSDVAGSPPKTTAAIFMPTYDDMYPGGVRKELARTSGSVVEIQGFGSSRDREIRPHFFRGAATQASKLFHAVQPTNAYFGQKDIQQALLIRRVARDLLYGNPSSDNIQIVPTYRAPDGIALASRNAYLNPAERAVAPILYKALQLAESSWKAGEGREASVNKAIALIESTAQEVNKKGMDLRVDHIEMYDTEEYAIVNNDTKPSDGKPVVLSGAAWLGGTRLVDTILLGNWGSKNLTT